MEHHVSGPEGDYLMQSFNNPTPRGYRTWDLASQSTSSRSQPQSETSSDSGASFGNHSDYSMNRGNGGYRGRGGGGGRGRSGFPGARGSRRYSSSSGSSSGQHNRPVLRPSLAPRGIAASSVQRTQDTSQADPLDTPSKEHAYTSFTLNGNIISETYTPSGTANISPSGSRPLPHRNRMNGAPTQQHATRRPTNGYTSWAYQQERKIKLLGMPKTCWTKQIYEGLSQYGIVVRIEMQHGSLDNNAWVVFQAPLRRNLPQQVVVGQARVKWEESNPFVRTIPSPVDPQKHYYEINTLLANSVDFGSIDAKMSMVIMHTVQARAKVRFMLNLERKELDIRFPQVISGRMRQYRFRLPFALLSHMYKDQHSSLGQTALIIPFDSPPQFFVQRQEGEILADGSENTSFSSKEKAWTDWFTWFRETDVVDTDVRKALSEMPLMSHKGTAIIDIGRWTSYRLFLDDALFNTPQYMEFANALADYGIEIKDCSNYMTKGREPSPLWALLQDEISGTHPHLEPSSATPDFDNLFAGQSYLPFQVRYQLEACLSNGYLKEYTISTEFLEKLAQDSRRAIYVLEKVVDKQQVYFDPMEIFSIQLKGSLDKKVPSYCLLQRSVIITPTMMHVASPIIETSNRITREYAADADRFLRVKFTDEKTEGVLRNMQNGRADNLFDRVRRAMKHGIVVAGRYYEFLAFGNSQFREHAAYFYAPSSTMSADDIRSSLGQFDHIKTVAKFGARLGQCFSTTRAMGVKVTVVKIPDIERDGYCFTDGVGKLSLFLAQMAAQELGLPNAFDDPPSLFQFRLGGCKGVLALDPKVSRKEVHIRPSQFKFDAKFTGLEIIRSSALATPFFNRQIIVLLSDLGVPDHIFIQKQQEMVNDYEKAMTDEAIAIEKLRKHVDMNQTTLTMASMVLDGFMKSREPFMMSLLKLWRAATIKNLKEKARIAIEDGAFVLGCVDETGTLKGHQNNPQSKLDASRHDKIETLPEIFLQVSDTASNKKGLYKIIEGICVLARNPSLHPGDLRVVRAVDSPGLHHLKNVVVLPQTGDRDLANMCSGGDLDGDDYMVLWDVDLLPEIINVPPMDFTPEKPVEKEEAITVADISDFFVTYMQNDTLGQIAHAHLAQADMADEGVNSQACLELAKLHSQAVDYPKSGIPAQMSRDLRPGRWPHFMEKKHVHTSKIYTSAKILGKLYDLVVLVDFKPHWDNNFDARIIEAYDVSQSQLDKASEIKLIYDEALKRLMAKHGIRTEFEAWSVFVLAHNQESRDYKFAEEFGRTMGALKAQYREICREAAGMTNTDDWDHLGPFVAAMYTVTAREMQAALVECQDLSKIVGGHHVSTRLMDAEHMPLMSFPWLFPSELGIIATGLRRPGGPLSTLSPYVPAFSTHKRKAPRRLAGTEVADVETEEGLVHYGELLKLNFKAPIKDQAERGRMEEKHLSGNEVDQEAKEQKSEQVERAQLKRQGRDLEIRYKGGSSGT